MLISRQKGGIGLFTGLRYLTIVVIAHGQPVGDLTDGDVGDGRWLRAARGHEEADAGGAPAARRLPTSTPPTATDSSVVPLRQRPARAAAGGRRASLQVISEGVVTCRGVLDLSRVVEDMSGSRPARSATRAQRAGRALGPALSGPSGRSFVLEHSAEGYRARRRSWSGLPDGIDGKRAQAVTEWQGLLAGVEDVPGDEARAQALGEVA
jgi:hypothetical protein